MRQKGGKTDLVSSLKCFLGECVMLCKLMQVLSYKVVNKENRSRHRLDTYSILNLLGV